MVRLHKDGSTALEVGSDIVLLAITKYCQEPGTIHSNSCVSDIEALMSHPGEDIGTTFRLKKNVSGYKSYYGERNSNIGIMNHILYLFNVNQHSC